MIYVARDGKRHDIKGKVGDNVLYLAHRYAIELEGASVFVYEFAFGVPFINVNL